MSDYRGAIDEVRWIRWGALGVILSLSSQSFAQEDRNQPARAGEAERRVEAGEQAETGANREPGGQPETGTAAGVQGEAGTERRSDADRDADGSMEPRIQDNSEERPEPPGGTYRSGDLTDPTVEKAAGMGSEVAYADRGVVELGGTVGLDIRDEIFTFRIAPSFGYFIADRVQLTLLPIINIVNVSDNTDAGSETNVAVSVVLEPSYHLPITDAFYAFAGLGLGVTYQEGPGVDFLLRPVLGVDIMVGRSGILKPYGFMDVGVGNGAVGGGLMAGFTVMF